MRTAFLLLFCAILCGCRDSQQGASPAPAPTNSGNAAPIVVRLEVLVVDDPEIATGIRLLRGEWSERSGGDLQVVETTSEDLLKQETVQADLIVYPSRLLGELVVRDALRPVRQSARDDTQLVYSDLLPVLRDRVMRFGGQLYGVSLGEMPLVLSWSGELPARVPRTWEQLENTGISANSARAPDHPRHEIAGKAFPLTAEFIARTVASTKANDRMGLFFDLDTMDARLQSSQAIRAVERMLASADERSAADDPDLWQVTVPPREGRASGRITPLPAAEQVYDTSLDRWDANEILSPPVICGFAGRLVSVTTHSRNAATAFQLLPWLVGGQIGAQLSQRSRATLWARLSQTAHAQQWLSQENAAEAAEWLTEALSQEEAYLLPRIPGCDRYLAALESALEQAFSNRVAPRKALESAEARWNEITDSLGREQQRQALRMHFGLLD